MLEIPDSVDEGRRKAVKKIGSLGIASLAGCANVLKGDQETSNSPDDDTSEPTEPPTEEPVNDTEGSDEETEEPEQEGLTWEKVLEPHNEYKRQRADQELIEKAVNGEKPGEDYGILFDHPEYGPVTLTGENGTAELVAEYSHGKEYFDMDHFEGLNPNDFDEFLDILNDAVTLKVHKLTKNNGQGVSGYTGDYSFTAEELIEDVFPDVNIETLPTGNDGHGFLYAFSEDHGGILVDSTSKRSGKIGENVLEGRDGYDWIGDEDLIENIRNIPSVGGRAVGALSTFYIEGDGNYGIEPQLLVEIYEDIQDDADQVFDKVQPMVAATSYLREYTDEIDQDTNTVITGTLDEIPSRSELESFEAYKEELKPHLVTLEEYQENND